jgi:D-glycero-D-manno-heptose 1,7-bisphosphate phosphatase
VPLNRAVFLDRDGTLIMDPGYLTNPDQVVLLPGVAGAIRRLNQSGLLAIVVTNQSGIARGLLTVAMYHATEARLDHALHSEGARLDASYFCPHLPEISGPCECRKPGTLLYRQAAERFRIDPGASWWIGDRLRDIEPARAFSGRGILIGPESAEAEEALRSGFRVAGSLSDAVDLILPPK